MDLITLDFETYYDKQYSLGKMSTEDYVTDERFEVIGVGVRKNLEQIGWFSGTMEETGEYLKQFDMPNNSLLCWNTKFDGLILQHHFDIVPKFYMDGMLMARAVLRTAIGSVALKSVAKVLGLPSKGTEVHDFIARRRETFTPEELQSYGDYCINDVAITHLAFIHLSKSFPKDELKVIDTTIRMYTVPLLELDDSVLTEKVDSIEDQQAKALAESGYEKIQFTSNPKFAALLEDHGVSPPMKISPTTGKETFALAKSDPGFKKLLIHNNPTIVKLAKTRLLFRSTIDLTRSNKLRDISVNHKRLRVPLRYYGAHTGRYSGDEGINLQNLPRGSALREAIIAPDGYVLLVGDLAQIEARITAWLAGERHLLSRFANNEDVYSWFAGEIYNRPINKKDNPDERFVGKTSILGLGYGMGGEKFYETLKLSMDIPQQFCVHTVKRYRQIFPGIPALWRTADRVMEYMINGHTQNVFNGTCTIERNRLRLPNGLHLMYPGLNIHEGTYTNASKLTTLWGGKLVENVVQALAQIIIKYQMLLIQEQYPVVLQVHDEIIAVCPEDQAHVGVRYMQKCMEMRPDWADASLPIAAEVEYAKRYGEAK